MGKFKIPETPPTVNKTVRFPGDVVEDVEKAIVGKDTNHSLCSLSLWYCNCKTFTNLSSYTYLVQVRTVGKHFFHGVGNARTSVSWFFVFVCSGHILHYQRSIAIILWIDGCEFHIEYMNTVIVMAIASPVPAT